MPALHVHSDRVPASRVPAPRKLLKSLRGLLIRTHRIRAARATHGDEARWCDLVFDTLSVLVERGDKVLPPHVDPRDWRRVRKRKGAAGGSAP